MRVQGPKNLKQTNIRHNNFNIARAREGGIEPRRLVDRSARRAEGFEDERYTVHCLAFSRGCRAGVAVTRSSPTRIAIKFTTQHLPEPFEEKTSSLGVVDQIPRNSIINQIFDHVGRSFQTCTWLCRLASATTK